MDEAEPDPKPGKYPSLDDILRDEPEPQFLLPCSICNKTFNPESLQRHSKICEKNSTRKRKQFDSFKQRVHGTGIAEFLSLTTVRKEKHSSPSKAVNSWKEKHEAFVCAIRAARCTDTTNEKSIHSLSGDGRTPLRHSDHEQCPHCGRSFGPKSFDRHIEWCREQRQRQPPSAASQQARERLEARIKYRAPPCKSKRSLMREKYSPLAQRKVRDQSPSSAHVMTNASLANTPSSIMMKSMSAGSQKSQPPEPPVRYNRAFSSTTNRTQGKETNSSQGLNRGGISRTSIRASQRAAQRSLSPKKPVSSASTKPSKTPPYRPSSRASDRRSSESLSLVLSPTEVPLLDCNPSNTRLSTKKKGQSNENILVQSPPQIIPKIETDCSRRNSTQRPYQTLSPEIPVPDTTEEPLNSPHQAHTDTLIGTASKCASCSEGLSGREESSTPYLLSDSDESGHDAQVKEPNLNSFKIVSGEVEKDWSVRNNKGTKPVTTLTVGHPVRKRRRVSTPGSPGCIDVFQDRYRTNSVKHCSIFTGGQDKSAAGVFRDEGIIDLDTLSTHSDSDEFDVDPSSDDDFRGKRTSCSASTYTKDRSSFVDGVRVSSSEKDDSSQHPPNEKIESPETASPGSTRMAVPITTVPPAKMNDEPEEKLNKKAQARSPNIGNGRNSGRNSGKAVNRITVVKSRTPSPALSPRYWAGIQSTPLKLPSIPAPKFQQRAIPDRKFQPFSAVRMTSVKALQLESVITTAVIPVPVYRFKNKIPSKLIPLRKNNLVDVTLSVVSEPEKPDTYDPYQSAERQMFELFNSDSAADLSVAAENLKNQEKRAPSSSPPISPSHSPTPCPPLETSPTSAFTRYSKENDLEPRTPSPVPAPPPRQHRSASVELPSITGQPRPHLKSHHSLEAALESHFEIPESPKAFLANRYSNERPRTYDIYSKEDRQPSPVSSVKDDSTPDILVMIDSPSTPVDTPPLESISPPPEFVERRDRPIPKTKESRESREIREITEDTSEMESDRDISTLSQQFLEFSDEVSIDNLMEEVARMQQYVSLMSNTSQPRPKHQSAKSRRSRASKMHIEDYLYPADSPMRGTTPIIGDVFNTVLDLNANTDNEDNDVVVSPNALAEALKSEIRPRVDHTGGLISPVRSKDLDSFSPDSSRNTRIPVEAVATDIRRRLPGDSDEDEVRSSRNSPVPRTTSNRQSTGSRLSGDSAYSSSKGTAPVRPSRQIRNISPTSLLSQSLQTQSLTQSRDLSSSGSESSLHAMSTSLTSRKSLSLNPSLSKFCHECGTKFPVFTAKFCPECGIRRLGM